MNLQNVRIKNFRCFEDFSLDLAGESGLVIAPNGGGKTSLLDAIAKAYGRASGVSRQDFRSLDDQIEITATLGGFTAADQGTFPDELDFSGPPTLHVGFRATWDEDEEEVDTLYGFPDRAWVRASRRQRDALALNWLPAPRDAGRALQI